ncbi:MAG: DUF3817 domain-containing protein [Sulfurimonas sp.]|jgi:integral membrane protein|nr:DUF3817 domain-containing protein [Sulfurimonadaceae bacterium]
MQNNTIKNFAKINHIEGYSYIILVFIAMPLKYFMGFPIAVKIVGSIHGILFIIFCYLLFKSMLLKKWTFANSVTYFIASLLPFGTFFTQKSIEKHI